MSENTLPDAGSVHAHVGMICFKTGPPHHVGIELEWLLSSTSHPDRHLSPHTLDDVVRRTGLEADHAHKSVDRARVRQRVLTHPASPFLVAAA